MILGISRPLEKKEQTLESYRLGENNVERFFSYLEKFVKQDCISWPSRHFYSLNFDILVEVFS